MGIYGTPGFRFEDPSVRLITEEDIAALIGLCRLNYGDDYPLQDLYDPVWVKQGIHSDHNIWRVIEEADEVVASGALVLAEMGEAIRMRVEGGFC